MQQSLAEHPEYRQSFEALQANVNAMAGMSAARSGEKHIIPVVFHVFWDECADNISMAQILDGLRVLNEDFNRTNADADQTRDVFKDVAADSEVEFRLARLDPAGNETDGVVRIQTPATVEAQNNIKSLSYWPSDRYLNIWVVQSIFNFTGGGGMILGYAQFPGSGSWNTYGVVIRHDALGTIGTSNADGRTLSHEVGHCLNLFHTFQDGCGSSCGSSGDFICDTPPSSGATYNCSTTTNSCGNDSWGSSPFSTDVPDMIENYMSYNSCQNLFTIGQKDRMKNTLNNVSTLESLTSEANLAATGVVGIIKANFTTHNQVVCEGQPVVFNDHSYYDAETFSWDFGGYAIPGESNVENPEVTFYSPGLQEVSYNVSSDNVSAGTTKKIFVAASVGQYAPFVDDMENYITLPTNEWIAFNTDMDEHEWKSTNEAAYSGSRSLKMDNFGACGEHYDELVSQSFDFSTFSQVQITFMEAFAMRQAGDDDFLRFYVSTDCGANWELNWVRGASALASVTNPVSTPFAPAGPSEWKEQSIVLSAANYMQEGVLLKFEFVGKGGNNLFLDDFNVTGTFNGNLLLRMPENGKQGLTSDVLLDWKAVGDVDYYEYQLDKTPDFNTAALVTGTKTYIDATPVNEDTEFMAAGLELGATYYWRVRYHDNGADSDWSDTWQFTVSETGVGIAETGAGNFNIYPNPAHGQVTVALETGISSVLLMDYTGRVAMNVPASGSDQMNVQLRGLAPGVYSLQVTSQEGERFIKSLVVR